MIRAKKLLFLVKAFNKILLNLLLIKLKKRCFDIDFKKDKNLRSFKLLS